MLADMRALNSELLDNAFTHMLPATSEILRTVARARVVSRLDLTKCFLQFGLAKQSLGKIGCTDPVTGKIYAFTRIQFGLKTASGHVQQVLDKLFQECNHFLSGYIDDLICFSNSVEEHILHISKVLTILNEAHLRLNTDKCKIGYTSCQILAHRVGNGKIMIDKAKVEEVMRWEPPATGDQLASYLGFVNFLKDFLPRVGTHVKKLEEVKNEKRIKWTPELLEAFETMQQIVPNAPILSEFIPGLPTFLQTDASKNALGGNAVPNQGNRTGTERRERPAHDPWKDQIHWILFEKFERGTNALQKPTQRTLSSTYVHRKVQNLFKGTEVQSPHRQCINHAHENTTHERSASGRDALPIRVRL